jgi:RimJ/RimL family protein N-acetyltransferase
MEIVVTTARLRLRRLVAEDIVPIGDLLLSDPEVMRFYPPDYSREKAQWWVDRQFWRYREHGHGLYTVEDLSTHEFIGQVGVMLQEINDEQHPELGWLIARSHWRRGYAFEAASSLLEFARSRLGYTYLCSMIRPENLPSTGVARKLGMSPVRLVSWNGVMHQMFRLDL